MNRITAIAAALIATAASFGAQAQTTGSYDYASKFYPHPAWLYLSAEAPREMGQHPAVIVARRAAAGSETVAQAWDHAYPHPAWGYAAAESAHEMGQHPAVIVARRAADAEAEAEAEAAAQAAAELKLAQR